MNISSGRIKRPKIDDKKINPMDYPNKWIKFKRRFTAKFFQTIRGIYGQFRK